MTKKQSLAINLSSLMCKQWAVETKDESHVSKENITKTANRILKGQLYRDKFGYPATIERLQELIATREGELENLSDEDKLWLEVMC